MKYRIFFISLTLIFLFACGARWQTLSEAGFTIQMPGKPDKQTQSVDSPYGPVTIHMYNVTLKDEVFMVGYNEFKASAAADIDVEQLLNNAFKEESEGAKEKITGERAITLNGKPGKEITGEVDMLKERVGGFFTARVYWDSPRYYQVLYIQNKGGSASENKEKFLNSFQLTGK